MRGLPALFQSFLSMLGLKDAPWAGPLLFMVILALALPMISFVYGNYGFDTLFWLMATSAAIIFVAVACLPSKLPQPAAAAA